MTNEDLLVQAIQKELQQGDVSKLRKILKRFLRIYSVWVKIRNGDFEATREYWIQWRDGHSDWFFAAEERVFVVYLAQLCQEQVFNWGGPDYESGSFLGDGRFSPIDEAFYL